MSTLLSKSTLIPDEPEKLYLRTYSMEMPINFEPEKLRDF